MKIRYNINHYGRGFFMDLFSVESLCVKSIIDDLSFSVSKSDMLAILCPNNGGKSTLIKVLSGVSLADSGKILMNGVKVTKRNFKKYIVHIGTVFEDIDNQFLCEKVKDELSFPLIHLCYDSSVIKEKVETFSSILKINDLLDKNISDLSLYEKIRVLIATSIIYEPEILFLDDIFRNINKKDFQELMHILENIKIICNLSIIYTTSSIENIIDLENIIVISNGKKTLQGRFSEIILEDNELTKMGFEIPIMVDLSRKLQFYNLIDDIYLDVDSVVNKLWK